MPHLARPTSRRLTNKSAGAQRFEAGPQHSAVSLRLTDQPSHISDRPEAAPKGGIASRIFLSSRDGKPEACRYVPRQSRVALAA